VNGPAQRPIALPPSSSLAIPFKIQLHGEEDLWVRRLAAREGVSVAMTIRALVSAVMEAETRSGEAIDLASLELRRA